MARLPPSPQVWRTREWMQGRRASAVAKTSFVARFSPYERSDSRVTAGRYGQSQEGIRNGGEHYFSSSATNYVIFSVLTSPLSPSHSTALPLEAAHMDHSEGMGHPLLPALCPFI